MDKPPPSETLPADRPEESRTSIWPALDLLRADQRRRWEQGERALVETYLEREPGLRTDTEALLDLIYNEVVCRELSGEQPELGEYQQRFPHLADQLKDQFDVHRALGAEP